LESGISEQSVKESVWTQYILNQPKMKVNQMPRITFKLEKLVKSGDSHVAGCSLVRINRHVYRNLMVAVAVKLSEWVSTPK
jgi:hypothetical protein